jgi:hypothetical protein
LLIALEEGDRGWKQAQRQGDFRDNSIITDNSIIYYEFWQLEKRTGFEDGF